MIKLKCHCGSEVEVDFSRAAVAYEKESNYIKEWLETHKCKQTGGFITSPPTTDNKIMYPTHPPKMPDAGPVIPQVRSGSVSAKDTYTVINYTYGGEREDPPPTQLKA